MQCIPVRSEMLAEWTRLELATPSVTGWCSNQLSYTPTEKDEENSQTAFYFKRKLTKTLRSFFLSLSVKLIDHSHDAASGKAAPLKG